MVLDGTPHAYERVDEVVDLVAVKQLASVADLKLGRSAALLVLCERDAERLHGFGHGWNVTTFARRTRRNAGRAAHSSTTRGSSLARARCGAHAVAGYGLG